MEHKPDLLVIFGHGIDRSAVIERHAAGGHIHFAEQVEESGLAAAAAAEDDDEPVLGQGEADAVDGDDAFALGAVNFGKDSQL